MIYDESLDFLCDHLHVNQCCSEEFFANSESLQIRRWSPQDHQTGFLVKYYFDSFFRDWPLNVGRKDVFLFCFLDLAGRDQPRPDSSSPCGCGGGKLMVVFPNSKVRLSAVSNFSAHFSAACLNIQPRRLCAVLILLRKSLARIILPAYVFSDNSGVLPSQTGSW